MGPRDAPLWFKLRHIRTKWTDRRPRSSPSSSGALSGTVTATEERPLHCAQEQETRTGPR